MSNDIRKKRKKEKEKYENLQMGINWTIENKRLFTLFYFSSIRGMFLTQKEKRKHDLTLFHHFVLRFFNLPTIH